LDTKSNNWKLHDSNGVAVWNYLVSLNTKARPREGHSLASHRATSAKKIVAVDPATNGRRLANALLPPARSSRPLAEAAPACADRRRTPRLPPATMRPSPASSAGSAAPPLLPPRSCAAPMGLAAASSRASSASSPWSWGLAAAPGGAAAAAPPRRLPGTCSPPLPRAGTRHGRRPGRRGGGGRAKKGRDGARGARRHLPSRTSRPPDPAAAATGRARGRRI